MTRGMTPLPIPAREQVDLEIRCQPQSHVLGSIRTVVTALARDHGFDEESVEQIEMATDEACANIVNHAYRHLEATSNESVEMCIKIQIGLGNNGMTIHVIDNGIGLKNQKDKGVRNVDDFIGRGARGGLGLHIIEQFMDEVRYEYPENEGTCVIMTKLFESNRSASG